MSEPIRDTETAVRELGALPVPVGTAALTAEQRAAVVELIGDAKPATGRLLEQLAESVRDRREHEHPKWEDLFCLNLVSWAGERMGPVLRRLLDADARVAELETLTAQATEFRLWEPGYGLYVRRAPGTQGFAVMEARRTDKGRRVWTTSGWQYGTVLSDTELFCWPDAETAVAEAQRVMPGAVVREEPVEAQQRLTLHDHIVARDAEIERLKARVTELEVAAVEGRAALAALCHDLDDPGSMALGALYLLQQATPGTPMEPGETVPKVYRASHDSIVMGLYTTATEARVHCVAEERRSWAKNEAPVFDWIEDEEDGVAELVTVDQDGETETITGYVVDALDVAVKYDEEADE
jgi:hypothetical protein